MVFLDITTPTFRAAPRHKKLSRQAGTGRRDNGLLSRRVPANGTDTNGTNGTNYAYHKKHILFDTSLCPMRYFSLHVNVMWSRNWCHVNVICECVWEVFDERWYAFNKSASVFISLSPRTVLSLPLLPLDRKHIDFMSVSEVVCFELFSASLTDTCSVQCREFCKYNAMLQWTHTFLKF